MALLLLGFCALFSLFAKGHVDNLDAVQTVYAARSFWHRGDLGLPAQPDAHSLPAESMIRGAAQPMGMEGAEGAFYVWFPVGHQMLLVPAVALGEGLARLAPGPEQALRAHEGPGWGDLFWVMFCASFVPTLAAGGCAVVLYLLLRELGLGVHAGMLSALLVTLGTQFWPMMVENLSDGPGQLCLFAAVLQGVRWFHRRGEPGALASLVWGGAWSGLAVCLRYPHALSVIVLGLFVVAAAWAGTRSRREAVRAAMAFAAGGIPWLVLLLLANYLRFGDPRVTGYPPDLFGDWLNYPPWLGALFQLGAFGKGMLWLSPLLIPALWWALRRPGRPLAADADPGASVTSAPLADSRWLQVLFWALFLVPLALFSCTDGWQAGECWGVRYVAPGMFLLVALALARRRPWSGGWLARTALIAFAALGLFASATGLVAPVRGYVDLAATATRAAYLEEGVVLSEAAVPLHMFVDWQFSPLHGNWTYAWLNATGRMQQGGSANTTEPIFGVATARKAPPKWPFTGFRHWWWVWLGDVAGWTVWPLALLLAALAAIALGLGWRGLLRNRGAPQVPGGMGR